MQLVVVVHVVLVSAHVMSAHLTGVAEGHGQLAAVSAHVLSKHSTGAVRGHAARSCRTCGRCVVESVVDVVVVGVVASVGVVVVVIVLVVGGAVVVVVVIAGHALAVYAHVMSAHLTGVASGHVQVGHAQLIPKVRTAKNTSVGDIRRIGLIEIAQEAMITNI